MPFDNLTNWKTESSRPFAVAEVKDWPQWVEVLHLDFLDWPEYIFRGQRDTAWSLRSKFDRHLRKAKAMLKKNKPLRGLRGTARALVEQANPKNSLDPREALLQRQFDRFRRACCGRRGASPPELPENEWWALGRHFGLATPLLDWTRSPYVACFFAMWEPESPKSGRRAVWAYSEIGTREILINQDENYDRGNDEIPSIELVESSSDENQRQLSQNAVFTRTPSGEDVEEFIGQRLKLAGNSPVLYRIDIPDDQRESFLRQLEAMNIHFGSLFPDLIGAAEFSNRGLEKEWSEILWRQHPNFVRRMLSNNACHE